MTRLALAVAAFVVLFILAGAGPRAVHQSPHVPKVEAPSPQPSDPVVTAPVKEPAVVEVPAEPLPDAAGVKPPELEPVPPQVGAPAKFRKPAARRHPHRDAHGTHSAAPRANGGQPASHSKVAPAAAAVPSCATIKHYLATFDKATIAALAAQATPEQRRAGEKCLGRKAK